MPSRKTVGQFLDSDIINADSFRRRDSAVEHMVKSFINAGMFDSQDILRLFDNTNLTLFPPVITADGTEVRIGNIATFRAKFNLLFDRQDGICQLTSPALEVPA